MKTIVCAKDDLVRRCVQIFRLQPGTVPKHGRSVLNGGIFAYSTVTVKYSKVEYSSYVTVLFVGGCGTDY